MIISRRRRSLRPEDHCFVLTRWSRSGRAARKVGRRPTGLYGKSPRRLGEMKKAFDIKANSEIANSSKLLATNYSLFAQNPASHDELCALPTWWFWRSGCTRSHSEHGRETLQRRWYFDLSHGRVGRCQVCKTQTSSHSQYTIPLRQHAETNGPPSKRPDLVLRRPKSSTVFCPRQKPAVMRTAVPAASMARGGAAR